MHYLLGTRIMVSDVERLSDSHGPRALNSAGPQFKRAKKNPYFEANVPYSLYNIVQNKDQTVVYTFLREDNQQTVSHQFKSIRHAETVIANSKGEALPDYDAFHRRYS